MIRDVVSVRDRTRIHYRKLGEGPGMVLLHGYPQTGHMWRKVMPALAERFTVVAPDLRGYGDSDRPIGGYDKRTMAADVADVIRALGVEPVVLVGHDRGARVLSPRTIADVTRNVTGDRVDGNMGMPMHRGLGPHLRGTTDTIRGLGSLASPRTFGHGGVGSSYCWADPDSGVSFAYLTNGRVPDPWHSARLDRVSNFVHAAIV
jgi:CubicO group peptidase (beta-lactamase class C family)